MINTRTFFLAVSFKHILSKILLVIFYLSIFLFPGILSAQKKLHDDLFSVSFPNEKDGWACGRWGTVLHTVDGGKTWVRRESGTDFTLSSIHFADPQNGWAVGEEGMIIYTKNGGKTWEKQKSPVPFYLMRIYFVTPLKGWIVTERTHILYTNDGGKTWSTQFKDQDFILKSISFCDPLHGWAVGEYGFIYHTKDGGTSWRRQAGHYELSKSTGEIGGEPFLFDVTAIDSQTAWAVGIDGHVARTLDGGATWQKVKNGIPKTHLLGVTSDKQGNILIGGNGLLLMSSDGGKTFGKAKFEPQISYGWIYRIVPKGGAGFVAVGKRGWIYLSDMGGTSWQRVVY